MALSEDTMSKCSEHFSAYKSACEKHPDLDAFDTALQQRTNKLIDSLTIDPDTGKLSQHAVHIEISKLLLEVTQGVEKFIIENKDEAWENEALKALVYAYFDNTIETMKIFNTIESCVEDAEMSQLYIQQAVADFDKESAEKNVGGKKKYEETLEDLRKFRARGNPFDDKVFTIQFEKIKKQKKSLLDEVLAAKKKLEKEYAKWEKAINLSHMVFGATLIAVTAVSIFLIASGAGAVAGFAALSTQMVAAGWVGTYTALDKKKDVLKKQLEDLQKQLDIENSVAQGLKTNEEATKTINTLVDGLEDRIDNMLNLVEEAIENEKDEADTKLILGKIRKKVDKLTEQIMEVGESVEKHSKVIAEARLNVLQTINRSRKRY